MHYRSALLALAALFFMLQPLRAETSPEYQVKMAYLYQFSKFVEWPEKSFADSTAPIAIGILGQDPFGDMLDAVVTAHKAKNRPLRIVRGKTLAELSTCHIIFFSQSEDKRQREMLATLADSSVVTIGETPNFTRDGGHIRFFLSKDQTIKIEVNPSAVHRAGVFISSRVMKIARIYDGKKSSGDE